VHIIAIKRDPCLSRVYCKVIAAATSSNDDSAPVAANGQLAIVAAVRVWKGDDKRGEASLTRNRFCLKHADPICLDGRGSPASEAVNMRLQTVFEGRNNRDGFSAHLPIRGDTNAEPSMSCVAHSDLQRICNGCAVLVADHKAAVGFVANRSRLHCIHLRAW